MSFRQKVLDAGAEAISELSMVDRYDETLVAQATLCAFLDCLAGNADKWIDATGVLEWHDWSERAIVAGLIDVLWEDCA